MPSIQDQIKSGDDLLHTNRRDFSAVPLFLLIGYPKTGKSSLLDNEKCGLFLVGQSDTAESAIKWYLFEGALFADTPGEWMDLAVRDGTNNPWPTLFKCLKSRRPTQSVCGIVLAISSEHLLQDDNFGDKVKKVIECFHAAREANLSQIPVAIVITKCDIVNGFREYFSHLRPGADSDRESTKQIVGFRANTLEGLSVGVATLRETIRRRRTAAIDKLPVSAGIADVDNLYSFPAHFGLLLDKAKPHLTALFFEQKARHNRHAQSLYGVYFTSAEQGNFSIDVELNELLQRGNTSTFASGNNRCPLFLHHLFKEIITKMSPPHVERTPRRPLQATLALLVIGVLLLVAAAWAVRSLDSSHGTHSAPQPPLPDSTPLKLKTYSAREITFGNLAGIKKQWAVIWLKTELLHFHPSAN